MIEKSFKMLALVALVFATNHQTSAQVQAPIISCKYI